MKVLLAFLVAFMVRVANESAAHAQGRTTTFALIVTSNHSTRLSRPDLRYADETAPSQTQRKH
jgi:hypothetical protein